MLDTKKLDEDGWCVNTITNETIYIHCDPNHILPEKKRIPISKVIEEINKKNPKYTNRGFDITGATGGSIPSYILVRQLNDYIKVFHWDTYAITFGHLDAFITKTPIKIPEGYKRIGKNLDEAIKVINQVFWLEPYDENDKELMKEIEDRRREIVNMLKSSNGVYGDDIVNLLNN